MQLPKEVIDDKKFTIGTSISVISPAVFNGQRKVITLMNNSLGGQIISIGTLGAAKAGEGIVLNPTDRYVESADAGFRPSNEQITAISSAAGGVLAKHEVILLE